MRLRSVLGRRPRMAAAPVGPSTCHPTRDSTRSRCDRSTSTIRSLAEAGAHRSTSTTTAWRRSSSACARDGSSCRRCRSTSTPRCAAPPSCTSCCAEPDRSGGRAGPAEVRPCRPTCPGRSAALPDALARPGVRYLSGGAQLGRSVGAPPRRAAMPTPSLFRWSGPDGRRAGHLEYRHPPGTGLRRGARWSGFSRVGRPRRRRVAGLPVGRRRP